MTRYAIVRSSDRRWYAGRDWDGRPIWTPAASEAIPFAGMSLAILTAQDVIPDGTKWDVEPIAEPQEAA